MSPKIEAFVPILKWFSILISIVGLLLLLFPGGFIVLLRVEPPESLLIFRWLGALTAACGMVASIASVNPARHWPIWAGGLFALIAILVSSLIALLTGDGPFGISLSVAILALIWGIPVARVCLFIAREPAGGESPPALPTDLDLTKYRTQLGISLDALSRERPVLLVLLRHLGCTFCRETLADIAAQRREIEAAGAQIVLVHMGEDAKTRYLFERYRLEDIPRISDPEASLYRELSLERGSFMQIYGPGMWRYTVQSILLDGHGMGQIVGDRFQMPGAFLVQNGMVTGGMRHRRISDHPDYLSIIRVAAPAEEVSY